MKLKELKKGDFFTKKPIAEPRDNQVWIKGEYDRSTKRYFCTRFSDSCDEWLFHPDREVFCDFVF